MSAHVACFGKLPFHREFLRLGVDAPAAKWIVQWVEQAHVAWTRQGDAPATSPVVRFAVPIDRRLMVGVVRQSSDGLRRHPVTLFVDGGDAAVRRPELVPAACEPTWRALTAMLDADTSSQAALTSALARGVVAPDFTAAESSHGETRRASSAIGAWTALAGATGDEARHLAINFLAALDAQRGATSAADGVAYAVPVDGTGASSQAALWLELVGAGGVTGLPALLVRTDPGLLVCLHRPPEGRDLAAALGDLAMAPIDDLREAWQKWPPADARLAAGVDALVAGKPTTAAELVDAVRALARG